MNVQELLVKLISAGIPKHYTIYAADGAPHNDEIAEVDDIYIDNDAEYVVIEYKSR